MSVVKRTQTLHSLGDTATAVITSNMATAQQHPQPQQQLQRKKPPPPAAPWTHFVAGGAGAMAGALVTSPLEVVKTRLQALHNKERLRRDKAAFGTRTFQSLSLLYQEQGIRSLYKGLVPHLVGVIPARAIYFGTFRLAQSHLYTTQWSSKTNPMLVDWLSAVLAGVTTITITNPIWFVKTRMQLDTINSAVTGGLRYKNSVDCTMKVFKHEGFRAFYTGMGASYVGISESSVQFMLYEKFKRVLRERKQAHGSNGGDRVGQQVGIMETVGASTMAKLLASALTYPHEVIRTRLREEGASTKYKGVIDAFKVVAQREGLQGLYGGLAPHLMRVVPNAAIMFLTYETLVQYLSATSPSILSSFSTSSSSSPATRPTSSSGSGSGSSSRSAYQQS